MLYRDRVEFVSGHGVAVHADVSPSDPQRAIRLETRIIPTYEATADDRADLGRGPALVELELDMRSLADAGPEDLPRLLEPLTKAYGEWIQNQGARVGDPEARLAGYEETAEDSLQACRVALGRIAEGIRVLQDDPAALRAFRFANRAMGLQRVHSIHAEQVRRGTRKADRASGSRHPEEPELVPVPARVHPAEPARPSPTRSTATAAIRPEAVCRPAVVPDRRRQDRGVPRADGVHAGAPAAAGGGRRALRRRTASPC